SARAAHVARRAADFGVILEKNIAIDMKRVKARADAIVESSRRRLESWVGSLDRCTVFRGHAELEGPVLVRVGGELLSSERIFLDVGGRGHVPKLPRVAEVPFLTNSSVLAQDTLPEHLVIVGGSYVGLEFAQMYRRFGAKVTVIEMASSLIHREDEEVSRA